MQYLRHPDEFRAMVRVYMSKNLKPNVVSDDWKFCYEMLVKVSRSFAVVIQNLGEELRDPICVFYLVLRALDTIEDDTTLDMAVKVPWMERFTQAMQRPDEFNFDCGVADEKYLLQNFGRVLVCFHGLKKAYQDVILDITDRMSRGMREFLQKRVTTLDDYNLYCHYVAGLVGIGLSKMFAVSGLEDASYAHMDGVSNSMGLFLQKTNIIRDYLEDNNDKRYFWPNQIWQQYANDFGDFTKTENSQQAVACLNHLVTDALVHATDCIEYLAGLRDARNFNFCAIPQVMAMATLCEIYNNHRVFTGVVKIRRGLTAKMMLDVQDNSMQAVCRWFHKYAKGISGKIDRRDPNASKTQAAADAVIKASRQHMEGTPSDSRLSSYVVMGTLSVVVLGAMAYFKTPMRLWAK